ncbi:MAG: lactate utilization protein [Mesorhizobium sp.]|nr:lactate utilization protein [Mesorhizobium sp.]MCO5160346.1 lactate utilization protein [Mesorhizobium sp.]
MSGRQAILSKVRASLAEAGDDAARRAVVEARLAKPPKGVIPARGKLPDDARVDLFETLATKFAATVQRVRSHDDVPKAVSAYLRAKNLPAAVRVGADRRLAAMPWDRQKALEVRSGASDGDDEAGVSHAFGGIAETGTLVMVSGKDNPSTINFLPEHHIVVVEAADIDGDMESVLARVRKKFGRGKMPRTLNFITGPSRSGDIEQKIILGAHGPRALHIILVDG